MRVVRCIAVLMLGAFLGAAGKRGSLGPAEAMVSVCFVPAEACETEIIDAIASARASIRVQAYGFTATPILRALAEARARGVDVQAILDKSDDTERVAVAGRATGARFTAEAGIPTWIDDSVAIAHNKAIIVDGHLIVGGSYNYTASAGRRNAENVTFIDSLAVADRYLANWESRKSVSRPSSYAVPADGARTIASSRTP